MIELSFAEVVLRNGVLTLCTESQTELFLFGGYTSRLKNIAGNVTLELSLSACWLGANTFWIWFILPSLLLLNQRKKEVIIVVNQIERNTSNFADASVFLVARCTFLVTRWFQGICGLANGTWNLEVQFCLFENSIMRRLSQSTSSSGRARRRPCSLWFLHFWILWSSLRWKAKGFHLRSFSSWSLN